VVTSKMRKRWVSKALEIRTQYFTPQHHLLAIQFHGAWCCCRSHLRNASSIECDLQMCRSVEYRCAVHYGSEMKQAQWRNMVVRDKSGRFRS
jgi:hypothetical protein